MKLIIADSGNDPSSFEDDSLTACFAKVLDVVHANNPDTCDYELEAILELFTNLMQRFDPDEPGLPISASAMSCMMDTIEACVGYESWDQYQEAKEMANG